MEEAEIGPVDGLHILHLQCHFGRDTLTLAQRGATVVGLDFSPRAIAVARDLAAELGIEQIEPALLRPTSMTLPKVLDQTFDLVFVNWGAICWFPDIRRWAEIVAHFIKPGGIPVPDGRPSLLEVFDNQKGIPDGMPDYFYPLFYRESFAI